MLSDIQNRYSTLINRFYEGVEHYTELTAQVVHWQDRTVHNTAYPLRISSTLTQIPIVENESRYRVLPKISSKPNLIQQESNLKISNVQLETSLLLTLEFKSLKDIILSCRTNIELINRAKKNPNFIKLVHHKLLTKINSFEKRTGSDSEFQFLKNFDNFKEWFEIQSNKVSENYVEVLLHNPHTLLKHSGFTETFPNLNECSCKTINQAVRIELEKSVVKAINNKFSDKSRPITIVSFGAGSCFQELVYITKLVDAGYKNINFVAMDNSEDTPRALADLRSFQEKYLQDANIQLHYRRHLDSITNVDENETPLQPDVFLMIDLAGEAEFLKECFAYLHNNSFKEKGCIIAYTKWKDNNDSYQRVQEAVCYVPL